MNGTIWVQLTPGGKRHVLGEVRSTMCGMGVTSLTPRVRPDDAPPCRDCRRAVQRRIARLTALEHTTWGEH